MQLRAPRAVALLAAALVLVALVPSVPVAVAARAGEGPRPAWQRIRLEVQRAVVAGRTVAWAEVGPGDGRPLLLLNGTGSPMAEWDPALLSALAARGCRVVVLDYPGLGGSDRLPGRLTFDALADVVAGFVESTGLGVVDVLGWSMGGFVAQRLLVRHPALVRRAVLAGTNPGGRRAVLGPEWVQQVDSDPGAGVRAYVRTNYPPGARSRGWDFVRRLHAVQATGAYPPDRVPASVYDDMVAAEDPWLRSDRNARDLSSVAVPVLVTTGADDVVTPAVNTRRIGRMIAGAQVRVWAGAGHSFLFQRPSRVAAAVAGFLS